MKARAKHLVFIFFIAALFIACFPLQILAIADGKVSSLQINQEASLSEDNTERALDIIHRAGGELTESDKTRLQALGLTEEQIQMLQGLNDENRNTTEFPNDWVEKELKWYDRPAVLFTALGVVIAVAMIILIWLSRTLLFYKVKQKRV